MFELIRSGRERSDCTAPYNVILDKEYTVKEFVETVVSRDREWGYIGIAAKGAIFGDPHCEYKWGKLLYDLPEEIHNRKIVSVKADGGWSRMDYLLEV